MDRGYVKLGIAVLLTTEMEQRAYQIYKNTIIKHGTKFARVLDFVKSSEDGRLFFIPQKNTAKVMEVLNSIP